MTCPKCSGFMELVEIFNKSKKVKAHRCINCGKYVQDYSTEIFCNICKKIPCYCVEKIDKRTKYKR